MARRDGIVYEGDNHSIGIDGLFVIYESLLTPIQFIEDNLSKKCSLSPKRCIANYAQCKF